MSQTAPEEFSGSRISTPTIIQNLALYEADGNFFEFWAANVAPNLSGSDADYIRHTFPRGNLLRCLVMELAFTMPVPCIEPSDSSFETSDMPAKSKGTGEDDANEDKQEPAMREELRKRLADVMGRTCWEGDKDFFGALPSWRCFAFVTGGIFFKLPQMNEADARELGALFGQVRPERMRSQWSKIQPHASFQKVAAGFEFRYPVNGQLTSAGNPTQWVTETITANAWTRTMPDGTVETKTFKTPFIPVAHFQWEEREEEIRGVPLFQRLKESLLDVLTAKMVRKGAVKQAGAGIQVLINAKTDASLPIPPGGAIQITATEPSMPADFKVVGSTVEDGPSERAEAEAMAQLYDQAFLNYHQKADGGSADPASGTALDKMGKRESKYREAFTAAEGRFLCDMLAKIITIEGFPCKASDITARYDPSSTMTTTERIALATVYFNEGFPEQALLALGNDEDAIDELLANREKSRTADMTGGPATLTAQAQAEIDKLMGMGDMVPKKGAAAQGDMGAGAGAA